MLLGDVYHYRQGYIWTDGIGNTISLLHNFSLIKVDNDKHIDFLNRLAYPRMHNP